MSHFTDWTPAKIAEHNKRVQASREKYQCLISSPPAIELKADEPVIRKPISVPFNPIQFSDCQQITNEFVIRIVPMGAPRMTRRPTERSRRFQVWRNEVKRQVGEQPVPDEVHFVAYIPMCKSWGKKRRAEMAGKPHRMKPDRDNCDKALCDALWAEDSAIWGGSQRKFWCLPGEERIELRLIYYRKKSLANPC